MKRANLYGLGKIGNDVSAYGNKIRNFRQSSCVRLYQFRLVFS